MGHERARPAPNRYRRITTATTTTIGTAILVGIMVNATAAGTITVQDGAGNSVAVLKASIPEGYYPLGPAQVQGLKVVTAAASDITVYYE